MVNKQQPLTDHQRELIAIIKAAHQNLAVARKLRNTEAARRIAEYKLAKERELERGIERIRLDLDLEVAQHASALDEALIEAYNEGVPIRRMALDGFGNQYDGGVNQLIVKLRTDGRVGNREGYQRGHESTVVFPVPVSVDTMIEQAAHVDAPEFKDLGTYEFVEGMEESRQRAVRLTLDPRDPYIGSLKDRFRPGGKRTGELSVILYVNRNDHEVHVWEGDDNDDIWVDSPAARWVTDHPEAARAGFDSVTVGA